MIDKTASNGLKKGFEANSGSELKNLIIWPKTRDFGLSGLKQPQATSSGLKWSLRNLILALHSKYEPFKLFFA